MTTADVLDARACYRASAGRDARFDGRFYLAVTTTGIYCRPSCPARQPRFENCRFFRTAAAASASGFRACKLCRPDMAPGTRQADPAGDLANRALRLIGEGLVDEIGVGGLAARLAVSQRTLHRVVLAEVGATPQQIATVRRVQTARSLLEETDLSMAEVAFASGFGSIRQFNDVIARELGAVPTRVREGRHTTSQAPTARGMTARGMTGQGATARGTTPQGATARGTTPQGATAQGAALTLRLRHRLPFAAGPLLAFLAAYAIPGLESVTRDGAAGTHTRIITGPHGHHEATARLGGDSGAVPVTLRLADMRDLTYVVAALRRLYDLDAEPDLVELALAGDDLLAPLVAARPGLRAPGAVDGFETAAYAVLGQQVSLAAGRTFAGRLVAAYGEEVATCGPVHRAFPSAEALAAADPVAIRTAIGITGARSVTLHALARAVTDGLDLSPGAARAHTRTELLALTGVGEWTAALIRWRCLGDPDVFPAGDLVARRALGGVTPAAATARAHAWSPWRSYALMHLWTSEALT